MQKQAFTLAALLIIVSNVFGQRKADWTAELPASANQIFFHSLTGVPIVRGNDYYAGMDIQTHAVKWTIKRTGLQAVASAVSGDGGEDFFEVAYTPFAVINNALVNTIDGKILLDKEKDGYKKIFDYEILADIDALLFRTYSDGFLRLHLIDKKTGDKRWSSNILKGSPTMKEKLDVKNPGEITQTMVPTGTTVFLQSNQLMIYTHQKEIIMVNVADGKAMWSEKLDPARIFFSADQKTAFFVEFDGGLLVTPGERRMGNEITAIDVASGKSLWKKPLKAEDRIKWYDLDGNKLLLVHAKGFNFFNTEDGTKLWKDDFGAKRISKIEENTEGYLVSYNYYATMQIDKNGKKLWKKPQIDADYSNTSVSEDADYTVYKYDNGKLYLMATQLSFYPNKTSKVKSFSMPITPLTKMEYDKERNTLIVFDKDGISLVNPDKYEKGILFKDVKVNVANIQSVEVRKDNYYFAGALDFVILKPEGNVIERHYKEPFDGKAFGLDLLNAGLAVGGAAYKMSGSVKAMKGAAEMTGGALSGNEGLQKSGEKQVNKADKQLKTGFIMSDMSNFITPARQSAFSQTQDFAYFFTKDKTSKEKVLIKISKDTGEELDKLILNDAHPVYKIDDIENRVLYADKKQLLGFEPKK